MDKRIQSYFKAYSDTDALYVTGDGQAFLSESKAINHSKLLKKDQQKVTKYTRKEYETAITEKPKKEKAAKTSGKSNEKTEQVDVLAIEGTENPKIEE